MTLIDYKINNLKEILQKRSSKVVLRGAGTLGKLALNALYKLSIKVDCFWDDDKKKHGKTYCGLKVLNTEEILKNYQNCNVFICSNYFSIIIPELNNYKFNNLFDCYEIIKNTNYQEIKNISNNEIHNFGDIYDNSPFNQNQIDIDRTLDLHLTGLKTQSSQNYKDDSENNFNIKCIDLVITERCSMKCIDCSNLMQYYKNPINSSFESVTKSVDTVMKCIDYLSEFRVIGGEPFMNKDIGKIINYLKTYNNFSKIIIYTNATIVPKGENLEALKDERVSLDITRYRTHKHSLENHDKLTKVLDDNKIEYITHTADKWTDSGRIKKYKRTEKNLKNIFLNCCVGDTLSILNGKLYRCPFSANAHNINAIPYNEHDIVDLVNYKDLKTVKSKLIKLYTRKDRSEYLTACKYCKGRDFNTPEIPAGLQTKEVLDNPKFN